MYCYYLVSVDEALSPSESQNRASILNQYVDVDHAYSPLLRNQLTCGSHAQLEIIYKI